jgi:hypothetical protein
VLAGGALLACATGRASWAGSSRILPYDEAVRNSREAAEAVLGRTGVESCLRGKITRALLGLSDSCAAHGQSNPLCSLADKAVVVTPMSLSFMDETAQGLLDLSSPALSSPAGAADPAPRSGQQPR